MIVPIGSHGFLSAAFGCRKIEGVQALLLLAILCLEKGNKEEFSFVTGMALHLAVAQGLHRASEGRLSSQIDLVGEQSCQSRARSDLFLGFVPAHILDLLFVGSMYVVVLLFLTESLAHTFGTIDCAMILGRPVRLSDQDIDVPVSTNQPFETQTHSFDTNRVQLPDGDTPAIRGYHLKQIQSRLLTAFYGANSDGGALSQNQCHPAVSLQSDLLSLSGNGVPHLEIEIQEAWTALLFPLRAPGLAHACAQLCILRQHEHEQQGFLPRSPFEAVRLFAAGVR